MIVADASVFIDLIFEYNPERSGMSQRFFEHIEQKEIPIFEPELFKIELVGQLVRRIKKDVALKIAEEFFGEVNFVDTSRLFETAFSIAYETGARAADSFYIATAKLKDAILVSNDKFQVESADKFGVDAYYLIEDFDKISERLSL